MSEDVLQHYGTPRHSGRYPWGSGKDPYQSARSFLGTVDQLKREGLSEKEIADYFQGSVRELRSWKSNARAEKLGGDRAQAFRLKEKGYSNVAIGERMGVPESTVRNLLKPASEVRSTATQNTADMLEKAVKDRKYIDIGGGVENQLGISRNRLDNAVQMLKDKGYTEHYVKVQQLGTGKYTSIKVLAAPEVTYSEVFKHRDEIEFPGFYSDDSGKTTHAIKPPVDISSSRLKIRYAEDGGTDMDGVIQLRRGVPDLSLGDARYAQVRIAVDGTHYLKGMAMYSDDMPKGVDLIFNTNKHKGTPALGEGVNSVLKQMKSDQDNPFGATIRQKTYIGKDGKEHQSPINIVNEEGDWSTWSKSISSQMLSKQSPILAKRQLGLAYDLKKDEFDEIMTLTNPVIKRQLLNKFADGCDSASVHLKAAGLPRQASKVILPFPSMKETEIYAPTFKNGERVVLIRYPHGGIFEIPELTVNNKDRAANSLIYNARDAVGINPKVAERLSGADFDGDTVLVIPTRGVKIKTSKPLEQLKNFNPSEEYLAPPGMIRPGKPGSGFKKQNQMGDVSNLITDMTIKGATSDEIARAVRHSMVVIDAEKHNLNWKQSAIDNGIAQLKTKYQGGPRSGASTLISRASSEERVRSRKETIDPTTGKKVYSYTGETYIQKAYKDPTTGKKKWATEGAIKSAQKSGKLPSNLDILGTREVARTQMSTKLAEVDDARKLISSADTPIENIYADHSNKLKALANRARKESYSVKPIPYSKEAKEAYSKEVAELNAKLNVALKNRPLERKAQLLANAKVRAVREANPDLDKDDLKKLKGRALTDARLSIGAKKQQIEISDREWEAIQAGAISTSKLQRIINNSDLDRLKQLAMPREYKGLSPAKVSRAKAMEANGHSLDEIADALGVSTSTVTKAIG